MPRVAVVPLAGGEVRRLHKGSNPSWSPDGTRIAFQCHPGICTMNADGTDVQRITDPPPGAIDEEPAWGPDVRILFTRARAGHPAGRDIFMFPGASGRETRVLGGRRDVFSPSWSPDGSRIAYIGAVGKGTEAPTGGFQLFVALWGSVEEGRQITRHGAARPDWSPDGTTIAFDAGSVVWIISAEGGTPRKLTPATTGRHTEGVGAFPSWSPDGERIIYMCQTGEFDDNDLCTMNADGTGRTTILDTPANEGVPAWQPERSPAQTSADFGFGRFPGGDVRLCPEGGFSAIRPSKTEVRRIVARVARAGNSPHPDPEALWDLMDPVLQRTYGSLEEFTSSIEATSVPHVYRRWGISGQVWGPKEQELLDIEAFCGDQVADATWMGSAYFPRFKGVSAGAVQLFLLAREDGLKLWFSY